MPESIAELIKQATLVRQIHDNFESMEGSTVVLVGTMASRRIMGKAAFCELADSSGCIQIYARRDDIGGEAHNNFKELEIGDRFGVKGQVFKTNKGEISVCARVSFCARVFGLKEPTTKNLSQEQRDTLAQLEQIEQAYVDAVEARTQSLLRTFDMFREVNLMETNVDRAREAMQRATEAYERATYELRQAQAALLEAVDTKNRPTSR